MFYRYLPILWNFWQEQLAERRREIGVRIALGATRG